MKRSSWVGLLLLLLSCFSRVRSCVTHRRQPTKLPRPWDSLGKNTGVGCHFLLQCMKVKSESEVAQLCLTLSNPMDCSLPGSSGHGIFQARVLEWGAIAFSVPNSGYPQKSLRAVLLWLCKLQYSVPEEALSSLCFTFVCFELLFFITLFSLTHD